MRTHILGVPRAAAGAGPAGPWRAHGPGRAGRARAGAAQHGPASLTRRTTGPILSVSRSANLDLETLI